MLIKFYSIRDSWGIRELSYHCRLKQLKLKTASVWSQIETSFCEFLKLFSLKVKYFLCTKKWFILFRIITNSLLQVQKPANSFSRWNTIWGREKMVELERTIIYCFNLFTTQMKKPKKYWNQQRSRHFQNFARISKSVNKVIIIFWLRNHWKFWKITVLFFGR